MFQCREPVLRAVGRKMDGCFCSRCSCSCPILSPSQHDEAKHVECRCNLARCWLPPASNFASASHAASHAPQVASKDAFSFLRTERQLGYVVSCGVRSIARSRGLSVQIQSAVMPPDQLEIEIETWLSAFRDGRLANLDDDALAEYKSAIAASLREVG